MKLLKGLYVYITSVLSVAFLLQTINKSHQPIAVVLIAAWAITSCIIMGLDSIISSYKK